MKTLILSTFGCLIMAGAGAQQIRYDALSIPDSLKKNVSAVVRYDNTLFEITDIDRASEKHHRVVTVLNKNGDDNLFFHSYSSSFVFLDDVDIKVYDALGKQLNKYKKKDLYTRSIDDGLIIDVKGHYFEVPASVYPITVEFIWELKYKGTLHYPAYQIGEDETSLEFSAFTAKVPKEIGLRYKAKNTSIKPAVKEEDKNITYSWTAKNLMPVEEEAGAVAHGKSLPHILLAPNKFQLDEYAGDMTTWKNYGIWYNNVVKGTDKLSETKKTFYKQLTANDKTDKEKVQTIYSYMQKNFRYVSIQLGIGGHKPLPAEFTDDKKYGDCKGLSNYVHAVLKTLNIRSHLVVINREVKDEPAEQDFPCDRFNHVILCVPLPKDTVWLECTSNTLPFGVLDMSTQNRNAVVVTETGGVLVPTPKSHSSENKINSVARVKLSAAGSGEASVSFHATGEYKELFSALLKDVKRDDQKYYLVRHFGFKQPDDFIVDVKNDAYTIVADIKLNIEKMPDFIAGNKMFLTPQMHKPWTSKLKAYDNRKTDFYLSCPFEKRDTTIYIIPDGYSVDALPSEQKLSFDYGTYHCKTWFNEADKSIYTSTELIVKEYHFPAEKYKALKTFFDDVTKSISQKIVIKKD